MEKNSSSQRSPELDSVPGNLDSVRVVFPVAIIPALTFFFTDGKKFIILNNVERITQ